MTITYKLVPTQLDCAPQVDDRNNVVVKVHWAYTGTDGKKSAGIGGTTELMYDPSQHDFIPYSELTQEQVVQWVLSSWSSDELNSNRGIINDQINIVSNPFPWVSQSDTIAPPETPAEPSLDNEVLSTE